MQQIIGFIPKKPNEDHLRVKNLTGTVIEMREKTILVGFEIIKKKNMSFMKVEYPFSECEKHFVSLDPVRKNTLTFHQFCNELKGFEVWKKNTEIPKWQLFWSNISIDYIFSKDGQFTVKDKPKCYNLN
jgi:hypothetical protein